MSNDKLQKKDSDSVKEKVQYALGFGVVGMMLFIAGFPMILLIILGTFSYFLWKTFSSTPANGIKEIFEFYLQANDILRDDDRKWFGFEIQDAIWRGEKILQMMPDPPPLVYFTLGSLYHKIGNHKSAVQHLGYLVENENSDEKHRAIASPELRNYVQTLRKIEQNSAEAPLTSAAIRSLERARRNRAGAILDISRHEVWALEEKSQEKLNGQTIEENSILQSVHEDSLEVEEQFQPVQTQSVLDITEFVTNQVEKVKSAKPREKKKANPFKNHKPITEVLHDIYDK